ncbi:MAG: thrombospondin type 3 repeat-containing protein [Gammaproteobacteria bacterium]
MNMGVSVMGCLCDILRQRRPRFAAALPKVISMHASYFAFHARRLIVNTAALLTVSVLWSAGAHGETLQSDGFVSGQAANFQGGFIVGEMAAARFSPTIPCPCSIDSLTVLFGGNTDTVTMGIQIWDDPGGTEPGTLIYSGEVVLTGSTTNLQQIDLTATPIVVTRPFRVALVFGHDGLPGIATDIDGSVDASANFILADFGGLSLWFASPTLGVSGDFVLRATVSDINTTDTDGDGITDNLDNCIDVANAEQRDDDADGYGNRCDADFNNDCVVSVIDLGIMRTVFFTTADEPDWSAAVDLNLDDTVNLIDLGLLRTLFFEPPGPSGLTDQCQ